MKLLSQTILLNPKRKLSIGETREIAKDSIIGVFGPSGCGKTSFLEYLYHHYHHQERVAYMKQDILLHPEFTVYETLWFYTILRRKEECENIPKVLEQMRMSHLTDCHVGGLSGGEKKRILLAYHLLDQTAQYILMDEPFSGIDPSNTDLIFSLMREKTKTRQCTIVLTAHHLPFQVDQQLDEKWTFVPTAMAHREQTLVVDRNQEDENEDALSDVSLDSRTSSIIGTCTDTTGAYGQWKYLFLRDRILDRRNKWVVAMRWTTPLFVVLLQQVLIGSFPRHLRHWEKSQDFLDLLKTIVLHTILLFTVSIVPIHLLNDHFHRRPIIHHEISQGIYRRNAYFFSAILWDQLSLILVSLCVALVLMPPDPLFGTTFVNIMMEMVFTNMLMWVCSASPRSSFHSTLVLISTYISIAFLGNMGLLLRNRSMKALQYISMTHLQSNLLLEALFRQHPTQAEQLGTMLSYLNLHGRLAWQWWALLSAGIWAALPLTIAVYFLFFFD